MPRKYLTPVEAPYPHIGKLISKHIKLAGTNKAEVARKLSVSSGTVGSYGKNKSVQVGILWNVGMAIKHNFFAEIGTLMPIPFVNTELEKSISEFKQQLAAKDELIKGKDEQIKDLEKELAIYKNIVLRTSQ
ncbi:MAG: hypothetical protein WC756_13470 [Taibaiella sp.]